MPRGSNVELTRERPDLTSVVLGVGWDAGAEKALDETLVGAAVLVGPTKRAVREDALVFFNQLSSPDLSVSQVEQALAGDQDQVEVDLGSVPEDVASVVMILYVNASPGRDRKLGQLRSCTLRVLNLADNSEIVRSENLAIGLTTETAAVLGELYRHAGGWKFRVIGQGYSAGLQGIANQYGIAL